MATRIAIMGLDEVVRLVNEWGTLPRRFDGREPAPADADLTTLADELHPIFAGHDPGVRVNALLDSTGVRPILSDELTRAWVVDEPGQAPRAAAALALREQLAAHPGRMGICADRQCADVYVDLSPAGRRRFCCLTCQNRARAEAFRKRHATS